MEETKFLITVEEIREKKILTFKVEDYSNEKGHIKFRDRDGLLKSFPVGNCQVEEVER